MKIPEAPKGYDPLRYVKSYPVERVRSVKNDNDGTVEIVMDCLDDGPQNSIPGFENQPTQAVMGMTRANAQKLIDQLAIALDETA